MIHAANQSLKPYLDYKDTGLPWLENIPSHWSIKRGKSIFNCIDIRSSTGNEELLTVSSKSGVVPRKNANVTMFKAESYVGYKLCWPGDLVINSLWAWATGLGVSSLHGIISSAYGVYRVKKVTEVIPQYIHYLVRSTPFQWELQVRSKGVWTSRLQLTDESFLNAPFPLPPLEEQNAIVHFLDYVDRRIRRYIRAKQKMIKVLNEQKQAIIHQAVTRGLYPNVRLKPSGVEWLGDVPEHWEVVRSKVIFREVDERSISGKETHLSMSQKKGLVPSSMIEERRLLSSSYVGAKICKSNDLVLNRLKAHLGVFALAPYEGLVSPDYTIFRPIKRICPSYFEIVLKTPACRVELRKRAKGIVQGFWRLYTDDFYNIYLPYPPYEEQREIIASLEFKLESINRTIEQTNLKITLLSEYRARLFADVITGKLDVREAAVLLPKELEEPVETEVEEAAAEEEELQDDAEQVIEEGEA